MYDLCVIGGGINGTGIARDAAGRGYQVLLLEKADLAAATSSASTKLIHGGLRYLEHMQFRLVSESLHERDKLLFAAPHLVWPLEFVLPHESFLRPRWKIALGLWLYDRLAPRSRLAGTRRLDLKRETEGIPLLDTYTHGFAYTDCWGEDARLVVLNAIDARERGAVIRTYCGCASLEPAPDGTAWLITDESGGTHCARAVVNATGPQARAFLEETGLSRPETPALQLVRGSHIVVPRLYEGDHAYILQQPDRRILFAIPFERGAFTLIGTTEVRQETPPEETGISGEETAYLLAAVNRSFKTPLTEDSVLWSFSGVRPLWKNRDDANLSRASRDYRLDLDQTRGPPLLSVFGGKLTTYRALSEKAVDRLAPFLGDARPPWTSYTPLPGGDLDHGNFEIFLETQRQRFPEVPPPLLRRLARAYGTRMDEILKDGLGECLGDDLHESEIAYLADQEWAHTPGDILWRRSKLGLHLAQTTIDELTRRLPSFLGETKR